ncbi:hypothetical protein KM043_012556 [Ampulex compressa]|nr:hypothetical protein KM043_012556 [Ampulex compressa]
MRIPRNVITRASPEFYSAKKDTAIVPDRAKPGKTNRADSASNPITHRSGETFGRKYAGVQSASLTMHLETKQDGTAHQLEVPPRLKISFSSWNLSSGIQRAPVETKVTAGGRRRRQGEERKATKKRKAGAR